MKSGQFLAKGFICDVCHQKRSVAGKKINHTRCSKIRQQRQLEENSQPQ